MHLVLGPEQTSVLLAYNRRELEALPDARPEIWLEVRRAGQLLTPGKPSLDFSGPTNAMVRLAFPPLGAGEVIEVRSLLFDRLAPGHRQLVNVSDAGGHVLAERMVSAQDPILRFTTGDDPGPPPTFSGFFRLGITHILIGFDHLLFLFALLIVCHRFGSAAAIITCFTVAHSISLALATFDLVALPSSIVEPLIAATIVYVGLENLLRRDALRGRWLLTFVFGLVHGLGFAGVLRELGVAQSGAAVLRPLLAFNLGVEVGQLCLAALILPLFFQLRKFPGFLRYGVPACSALVVTAGAFWLIERTLL